MQAWTLAYILPYALAAALYLAVQAGLGARAARVGRWALLLGWTAQFVDIGVRCFRMQHPLSSTAEAMSFIAWMVVGGFLAATVRYRLNAAGAFAVPVALVLLVLARGVQGEGAGVELTSPLGTTHVFLASVGVATFAMAAVLAIVYLMQDRRLKRKRFDLLRADSASLDTLDRLAGWCVSFGFPVFTLAIVTGAVWVARLQILRGSLALRPEYLLTVIAWLAFGLLLVVRVGAGWRGRRVAWMTLSGFAAAALVVVGYFLRHAA